MKFKEDDPAGRIANELLQQLGTPKLIVNFWMKDIVFRKIGLLKRRLHKNDDFEKFAETSTGLEFGFDYEEGFKAYGPLNAAVLTELLGVLDKIAEVFTTTRFEVATLVTINVNGLTIADSQLLAKFKLAYDKKDYAFKFKAA